MFWLKEKYIIYTIIFTKDKIYAYVGGDLDTWWKKFSQKEILDENCYQYIVFNQSKIFKKYENKIKLV